ncbi:uncharacterized protein LOC106154938 isoform X2 [Lingula anatina]|uniref:Uncharacterized protein LOC106154938 isoform X2 n=1 Tax=Lingula anatina TaxID=7574 RepID=A0A1S3HFX8_LINAN|nr:uncharacterized protein LOC106154938 isoform X2 [Lingula anatina]|eukprot:XP_013384960.1 uncharacterized protein LOC106154938 isoform X2 [Lingula anatina]
MASGKRKRLSSPKTSQNRRGNATEDFRAYMADVVSKGQICLSIALGHELRLFDLLGGFDEPKSCLDIAEAVGSEESYIKSWLKSMVSGKIVEVVESEEGETYYYLPKYRLPFLTSTENNLTSLTRQFPVKDHVYPDVVKSGKRDEPAVVGFSYLVDCGGHKKVIKIEKKADIYSEIKEAFNLLPETSLTLQVFNHEWEDFIDIDFLEDLPNKGKVIAIATTDVSVITSSTGALTQLKPLTLCAPVENVESTLPENPNGATENINHEMEQTNCVPLGDEENYLSDEAETFYEVADGVKIVLSDDFTEAVSTTEESAVSAAEALEELEHQTACHCAPSAELVENIAGLPLNGHVAEDKSWQTQHRQPLPIPFDYEIPLDKVSSAVKAALEGMQDLSDSQKSALLTVYEDATSRLGKLDRASDGEENNKPLPPLPKKRPVKRKKLKQVPDNALHTSAGEEANTAPSTTPEKTRVRKHKKSKTLPEGALEGFFKARASASKQTNEALSTTSDKQPVKRKKFKTLPEGALQTFFKARASAAEETNESFSTSTKKQRKKSKQVSEDRLQSKRGKYKAYSLAEKQELIELVAMYGTCNIARTVNIPRSTICTWKKDLAEEGVVRRSNGRRIGGGRACILGKETEEKLGNWCLEQMDRQTPISLEAICNQALKLAAERDIDFKASRGWVRRFLFRRGLSLKKKNTSQTAPTCT